jgi:lysozyme family protein
MTLEECLDKLFGNEGGLSLDPKDRGNWTSGKIGVGELKGSKYGISAMTYPTLDIKNLTLDQAKEIYKRDFWIKLGLDKLPTEISFDMFDTAVNSGVTRAVKLLQKCVKSVEDGVIGIDTINRARSFNPLRLKQIYNANRLLFMTDIPSWESQGKGWARRVAHNLLM